MKLVFHELSENQSKNHINICLFSLTVALKRPRTPLKTITGDEMWIYRYDPAQQHKFAQISKHVCCFFSHLWSYVLMNVFHKVKL